MDKPTVAMAGEIEGLRAAYAALNRGDVAGFVAGFDPGVVRVEFLGSPMGGTYRGLAEVTAHVARGRGAWAEGGCEPERFVVAGDRVIVAVRVRVRLKSETAWREGRTADVYTFRDGKVVEFRTFIDEQQALAWAGVQADA
jgi:ketosteroid isomerase-like protein